MITLDVAQGGERWFKERSIRPTASNFSRIVTSKGVPAGPNTQKRYALELCVARVLPDNQIKRFMGNEHTDRGKELESEAREEFARIMGVEVEEVGFITTDNGGKGCSPDGMIKINGIWQAGLEIKCPEPTIHAMRLLDGKLPDEHKAQVHGCMDVTGYDFWYYMSYCPGLNPLILRIERDSYTSMLSYEVENFIIYYADLLDRAMPILTRKEAS